MSVEYTKKTWYDGSEGGTPITAAELNRVETGIDDVVTQSNADKTNIDTHLAKKVNSSDGAHGLRYYNSELDYYDDTNEEWVEIQTGGGGTDTIVPNPEYGSVPSKAYSVGDYIYSVRGTLGTDILYVVTTPITRSDTLVVDTNIALSTDEGAEVFVANIISGESGVPPYNIVGLVNSDGTVTRYGSSKDNSDIANRTLSNIHDTTTTDEFYRYKNVGSLSFDGDIIQSGSKYIACSYSTRNIIHISEDGIHFEDIYVDAIQEALVYVFEATINNNTFYVGFGLDRNTGANGFIYYSTDLEHWTKSNFISETSSNYQTSGYFVLGGNMTYIKNNKFYWRIKLTYNDEVADAQIISTTDGINWTVESTNFEEIAGFANYGGAVHYDNDTVRFGEYYTTDGTTWSKVDELNELCETAAGGHGASISGICKIGNLYYVSFIGDYGEIYTSEDYEHFTNLTNSNVAFGDLYDTIPTIASSHWDAIIILSDSIIFILGGKDENQNPIQGYVVYDIQSNKFNHWEQLPSLSTSGNGYSYVIQQNCSITDSQVPLLSNNDNNNLYSLYKASPFTNEVSKALSILGVGEGGSGGASSADDVTYDNTNSGLSATNVQNAIDEVLAKETTVTTDSYGYVITDPKNTHVTIPPASLSGTASMAVKSGTQGNVYTITDHSGQTTADVYTKAAVDSLAGKNMSLVNVNSERVLTDSDSSVQMRFKTGAENGDVSCIVKASGNAATLTMNADASTVNVLTVQGAQNGYQTKVTASTTDLTPGTSSLTTGDIYVVYE